MTQHGLLLCKKVSIAYLADQYCHLICCKMDLSCRKAASCEKIVLCSTLPGLRDDLKFMQKCLILHEVSAWVKASVVLVIIARKHHVCSTETGFIAQETTRITLTTDGYYTSHHNTPLFCYMLMKRNMNLIIYTFTNKEWHCRLTKDKNKYTLMVKT